MSVTVIFDTESESEIRAFIGKVQDSGHRVQFAIKLLDADSDALLKYAHERGLVQTTD